MKIMMVVLMISFVIGGCSTTNNNIHYLVVNTTVNNTASSFATAVTKVPSKKGEIIPAGMKYCQLGVDPVNRDRQLAQNESFALLDRDVVVVMTTGSKKEVACVLRNGTSVAVNAEGKAIWIVVCGNQILNEIFVQNQNEHARQTLPSDLENDTIQGPKEYTVRQSPAPSSVARTTTYSTAGGETISTSNGGGWGGGSVGVWWNHPASTR